MEWIDVNDRLPTIECDWYDIAIWIGTDQGYWIQGAFENGTWFSSDGDSLVATNITHWCEITPPEKEHKTMIFE